MNLRFWKKAPPSFLDVLKGKLKLHGLQQQAIEEMLSQAGLKAEELTVLSPEDSPKSNQYCVIREGQVEQLHLSELPIEELPFLQGLPNLQVVSIRKCRISQVPDLSALEQLRELDLYQNQIREVGDLPALKKLELGDNQLTQIPRLTSPEKLETLGLSSNQIAKIAHLEGLANLKRLYLGHNQVRQIEGLSDLSSLQQLDLSYNQIPEIGQLAQLAALQDLSLNGNLISDISSLDQLPQLSRLSLLSNEIRQLSIPSLIQSCREIQIGHNPLAIFEKPREDFTPEDALTYERFIALHQKNRTQKPGPSRGRARNLRQNGSFSYHLHKGASGHIRGGIERLSGFFAVTVAQTTYTVGGVDVTANIEEGLGMVWLQGTCALIVPGFEARLSGSLFETGYEDKQVKFESLEGELKGLSYDVRIGKNRE